MPSKSHYSLLFICLFDRAKVLELILMFFNQLLLVVRDRVVPLVLSNGDQDLIGLVLGLLGVLLVWLAHHLCLVCVNECIRFLVSYLFKVWLEG